VVRITGSGTCKFHLFVYQQVPQESSNSFNLLRARLAENLKGSVTPEEERAELNSALIYLGLVLGFGISALGQSILFAQLCNSSSRVFHELLLQSLLRAPMRFFQVNTPGRVLNRVVNDMGVVDEFLQLFYRYTIRVKGPPVLGGVFLLRRTMSAILCVPVVL